MTARFLLCRATLTVGVLKKFIRLKFDLPARTYVRHATISVIYFVGVSSSSLSSSSSSRKINNAPVKIRT